ncbi:VacJ family lipoprotein [Candidatus Nitrosacidococcus sp. I8]|uniref:MlaA family lipoprotein n=1 Tax=Candidatus Nitrosacidococcus sp. I8 TaxID=2942908 RepID=UPI002226B481|nr:VacJ family lipoprotein [Candidatus Nitrosacidococcus sp. I8]CAH9019583.1 hypothetical protein NURINAE_01634 [Candidatus Nitrosacidococcus sp. I8]
MNKTSVAGWHTKFGLLLLITILAGCGSTTKIAAPDPRDPFERLNRTAYKMNEVTDRLLMKPVAKGYQKAVPGPIKKGIHNFFGNIDDVIVLVNDFLQGKFQHGITDMARVLTNSTVGLIGFVDMASLGGMKKHNEDFGQTLAVWGVKPGPYLIMPMSGPSTVRDAIGYGMYGAAWPITYFPSLGIRLGLSAVRTIDMRANLLAAKDILDESSLDPYVYMREAYFQRREFEIHDGKVPAKDSYDNFDFDDSDDDEDSASRNLLFKQYYSLVSKPTDPVFPEHFTPARPLKKKPDLNKEGIPGDKLVSNN